MISTWTVGRFLDTGQHSSANCETSYQLQKKSFPLPLAKGYLCSYQRVKADLQAPSASQATVRHLKAPGQSPAPSLPQQLTFITGYSLLPPPHFHCSLSYPFFPCFALTLQKGSLVHTQSPPKTIAVRYKHLGLSISPSLCSCPEGLRKQLCSGGRTHTQRD